MGQAHHPPRDAAAWRQSVGSPASGILHRGPGLLRGQRLAALQQLDRDAVRRLDEGHEAITRRAVDGDTLIHQLLAGGVDIIDAIGEMAEIAPATIFMLVPVIGEFEQRRAGLLGAFDILLGGKEDQGEAPLLVLYATHFRHAELVAEEIERLVDIADADHRVQVFHGHPPFRTLPGYGLLPAGLSNRREGTSDQYRLGRSPRVQALPAPSRNARRSLRVARKSSMETGRPKK